MPVRDSTDPEPLWLLSWQVRAADWMPTHRALLENTIQEQLPREQGPSSSLLRNASAENATQPAIIYTR